MVTEDQRPALEQAQHGICRGGRGGREPGLTMGLLGDERGREGHREEMKKRKHGSVGEGGNK